jgi:protocatechuate 3,4-dioxygenase beta subunit
MLQVKITPKIVIAFMLFSILVSCGESSINENEQTTKNQNMVGGPFQNREFMFIGMPEIINSIDTSAGWNQNGQKLLITGTIFKKDGKTPAPDVILYYYHTDVDGYYSSNEEMDKRALPHGYIRGWIKSDEQGKYSIYTVRPAPYPSLGDPAHIHPSIKEPTIDNAYYIDAFVFEGDPLLTKTKRKNYKGRGGSGILTTSLKGDLQVVEHDIILGLNIPNYPKK